MINLKLFSHLQGSNTASMILRPSRPGYLQYFIISSSVNYSIIVAGECPGELPGTQLLSFDIVLSSIAPLLDKNEKFRLAYDNGVLKLVEESGKFFVTPLCVEHASDYAREVVQRYLTITSELKDMDDVTEQREGLEEELRHLRTNYKEISITAGYAGPASNPWSEGPSSQDEIDKRFLPKIQELEDKLAVLGVSSGGEISELDFGDLKRIATIAARNNAVISMCGDYALVELSNSYVIQKATCGVRAVQGKLLQRLLQEEKGHFYSYKDEVVFRCVTGKAPATSDTMVFLQPYLPNARVDQSIITKGVVLEKYPIDMKGMLAIINVAQSKFDRMTFDMNNSLLVLENDRGERLEHVFDGSKGITLELKKLMAGDLTANPTMAVIDVPREVQRVIGLLREDMTLFVKERKIIIQSGTLYVVFAR